MPGRKHFFAGDVSPNHYTSWPPQSGINGDLGNTNILSGFSITICETYNRKTFAFWKRRPYLIIVADAADAVSVNFSGRCKFFQTERENLPFYCVHSMYNVCNLYKFVLIYEHLGVEFQLQKLYQCKNDNYQVWRRQIQNQSKKWKILNLRTSTTSRLL